MESLLAIAVIVGANALSGDRPQRIAILLVLLALAAVMTRPTKGFHEHLFAGEITSNVP